MKVLLIQPNCAEEVNKDFLSLQYPINLGYIASSLQKANHEVKMLDFNVMEKRKLNDTIKTFNPEVVGITAMTSSFVNAKKIISEVKKINNRIVTVIGGVHASALPIKTMEDVNDLDFLVFGEGEVTIVELLKNLSNPAKVDGIVFRKNKKIIKNKARKLTDRLDTFSFPNRELIDLNLYKKHHVSRGFSRKEFNVTELITSRGCPNKCIFCAGHINYGFRIRFRSYQNIAEEIEECIKKYNVNHVDIEDDTFTLNKELVRNLCKFFKENNLSWNCNTRVNTVDYDLLKLMATSGCRKVAFGVESGDPEIMEKNKKGITIQQVIKAVKDAKKAGIRYVECDFIIGSHTSETLESVKNTERLILKIMPDFLSLSIMCPFPGTELYNSMIKEGLLPENPNWETFSFFGDLPRYERLTYLTSKQMSKLQRSILRRYYSSPKFIFSQLAQIRDIGELKYFYRMGMSFVKELLLN